MARIRSIHPGFFTDEALVELDAKALLLLIGVYTECDDQGVFEWRPVRLKMRLFPVANVDVPALLEQLIAADAIKKVEHDGTQYGLVRNFRKYQRPKSPNAIHPMTVEWGNYVGLTLPAGETMPPEPPTIPKKAPEPPQMEDGGGRREEEKKDSERAARSTTIPKDWKPDAELVEYARAQGCSDPADTFERFRLHHGGKGTKHKDWRLTAQLWCRNERRFSPKGGTDPPPQQGWN